ncbi:MAG: carbon-nitrogen hydrolase [Prevotellaceae bacterium]|jgi:N-carbamoylputrescine amidase|nr:carbon-nitrogen hydrolase [Prevotellaceae bacterium]
MRIALIQQKNSENIAENISKLEQNLRACAMQGAELIIFQELHNSLYFCQTEDIKNFDLAETIPGYSTRLFSNLVKELGVVTVLSLFEKRAVGLYHNTAVVLEKDGSIAGIYRKMHIPDDPAFYEKFYFTPGDLGFQPIKTSAGNLGVLICWDQWYPEAARLMALNGADLLIYPTAIGWDLSDTKDEQARQRDAWIAVQRGHAVANNLPVITCNRVGYENDLSGVTSGIHFWGNSFVFGAQGELIAQAPDNEEFNLIAEIDLSHTEKLRRIWPFFRDRRIDSFGDLTKIWKG